MGYKYDSFLNKGREQDSGDQNNKGYFATEDALNAAYPVGQNGWYAIVGTTDTIWVWDGDTSAWVNTHNASVQSDWNQTDNTKLDFIKNKPALSITGNVITIGGNSITIPQNNKGYFANETALRAAYPTGQNGWFAFVGKILWTWNQNDWRCSQEQANWTQSDNTQVDFIKNKPVIDLNYDVIP